ncbi:hypothetical protein PRIPAC_77254 [Pristionchus pacificus]|uniref:Uncharacterized protein n=1 Tax=Pristionchus pacificus TaxID=54126 RepID=A0A2A6C550_PRIPA|nr:hypothetical protein PRIPAC_77254 [Pristionchus pacificus]|eukprot:PDM73141.1 hypothetical protein PRIPAC_39575 [Pristionchus pacificus]
MFGPSESRLVSLAQRLNFEFGGLQHKEDSSTRQASIYVQLRQQSYREPTLVSGINLKSIGIKYSTPDPFPQLGIKQAYVPAASSTNIAYKPYSDCLRARVRLTICGPQLDRLLDVTSPHGRTMRGLWLLPRRFQTIPQVGIKHFPQVAIKLDSNLWELLDSKLIPDTREGSRILSPAIATVTRKEDQSTGPRPLNMTILKEERPSDTPS